MFEDRGALAQGCDARSLGSEICQSQQTLEEPKKKGGRPHIFSWLLGSTWFLFISPTPPKIPEAIWAHMGSLIAEHNPARPPPRDRITRQTLAG